MLIQVRSKKLHAENFNTFPSNAKKGRIIFYVPNNTLYTCKNGIESGSDTTLIQNWSIGNFGIENLNSNNENRGRIIIADGSDGMEFSDCDGGTI